MHAHSAWVRRGARGRQTRIPDAVRVSTDTVWVLRTVSAPRMTLGIAAVVVLSSGYSSGAASRDSGVYLPFNGNLNKLNCKHNDPIKIANTCIIHTISC